MPSLTPYYQQTTPQGQVGVSSNPDDFGSQVGESIQNVGRGMESLNDSERAIVEAKGKLIASRSSAEASLAAGSMLIQMQRDPEFQKKYGEDGAGFAEAYKTNFEDYANNLIGQQQNPQAKKFLTEQLYGIGDEHFQKAIGFQAQVGSAWAGNQLSAMSDANTAAARMSPNDAPTIAVRNAKAIENAPYMTPVEKLKKIDEDNKAIALSAGMGQIEANPEGLINSLLPGTLEKFKGTARQQQILNDGKTINLPKDIGADMVKPYGAEKVNQIVQQTNAPNKYDALFEEAGRAFGVDPKELKMRSAAESDFKEGATGPNTPSGQSGGLMQLTEGTAKALGVTDRLDPRQSVFGAAKLLADLQDKAKGDQHMIDTMYYGGESPAQWGKNTEQYAENLAAVRSTATGKEDPNHTFAQVLDSMTKPQEAVMDQGAPWWFNQLSGADQAKMIQEAKQGVTWNQTKDEQQLRYKELLQNQQQKAAMNEFSGKLIENQATVEDVKSDPRLDNEHKVIAINAIRAEASRESKTSPSVVIGLIKDIHAGKITTEAQILQRIGTGPGDLGVDKLDFVRKELQDRNGDNGQDNAYMKQKTLTMLERTLGTNALGIQDSNKAPNVLAAQSEFLQNYQKGIEAGKSRSDLTNPASPDFAAKDLVTKYARTLQDIMGDKTKALSGLSNGQGVGTAAPAASNPAIPLFTSVDDPKYVEFQKVSPDGTLFRWSDGKTYPVKK